jgi:hypothetical protein
MLLGGAPDDTTTTLSAAIVSTLPTLNVSFTMAVSSRETTFHDTEHGTM